MKTIITGGRDYRLAVPDFIRLDQLRVELPITEVIIGPSSGVERWAWMWACLAHIQRTQFTMGPKRDIHADSSCIAKMIQAAEAVIIFPGGRRTKEITRRATVAGLKIHVIAS